MPAPRKGLLLERGTLRGTMSRPEKLIPPTLGLDFELRIIPPNETQPGLGTLDSRPSAPGKVWGSMT
jgi:hypothetical protein